MVATPTPTPVPGLECQPHDTYMVEVHVDGYVATLNAPNGLWSLSGPYEAFDSPEALLAIAEGLRLRQPGE
jgi:hypothetical protein